MELEESESPWLGYAEVWRSTKEPILEMRCSVKVVYKEYGRNDWTIGLLDAKTR
jgi:hypothetical protein